ncbi:hypothetical protein [Pararhodobacter sp.]|uniref:hypothetical protein n=1 Tax=Pararhodobacter sp. TaxID=2127056 RepID=UPI002AFE1AB0|nr:hypothetical protein [Pararhodobacter sp.]
MLTRRALLLGFVVAGCSRILVPDLPEQDVTSPPLVAPNVLKVVIFELGSQGLPFHTGMIVHTPQTRIIFDPLSTWESAQIQRDGQVFRDPSPEIEAAYLRREGLTTQALSRAVHIFEIAVPADVAAQAIALAGASDPNLPLQCAKEVSTLLAQLPGFEFVDPDVVPAVLYRTLREHPEFRYTRRAIH